MDVVLLIARLVLAAVFGVAGLAKLADRPGSRQALRDFGLPTLLAAPFGLLLPGAELVTAVLLLPRPTAWWGALAALILLLLFVAGISLNLARGRSPDCHCFGQLHAAPVGWSTLLRNGALALTAGFVMVAGFDDAGASAVGWWGGQSGAAQVALVGGLVGLLLVAAEGWLLLQLLRQQGRLLVRVEALEARGDASAPRGAAPAAPAAGLPVGSVAPAFRLTGLHGETLTLDALRAAGKPMLLVFSDPQCGPCNALLPEIGRWQREKARQLTIALISRGAVESNRTKRAEHGLTQVLLQHDREVAQSYQASGTPSAVLIRPDGRVGSPLAQGAEQIRDLVARSAGQLPLAPVANGHHGSAPSRSAPTAPVGTEAPAIKLPDLSGNIIELAASGGRATLVLFWNPGCGFCQRMLQDLKEWEAQPPPDAPQLLVVSTGTVEANRAMGLRSPVVLDTGFTVGRAFGASGTPSAVLVDAQGRIASDVAVGAPAVLALATGNAVSSSAR